MTKNRKLAACLTALVACAAGAETAAADDTVVRTDYTVAIDGEAFYNKAAITPTKDGDQTLQEDDQVRFHTEFPRISFWDHVGEDPTTSLGSATSVRGHLADVNPNGARVDCDGSRVTDYVPGRMDGTSTGGPTTYKVRVAEAIQTEMDCSPFGVYPKRFESPGAALGGGIFDAEFTVPATAIGQDEIRIPVEGFRSGPSASATTRRRRSASSAGRPRSSSRRSAGGTSPSTSCPCRSSRTRSRSRSPAGAGPQPIVDAQATAAKLTATDVTVPVTCPAGCAGTATVTRRRRRCRTAAKAKPLARKAFTVAPGATKRIRLTIPKKARKAVRRAGGVRVTLDVTPTGGARTTKRVTVKLKKRS